MASQGPGNTPSRLSPSDEACETPPASPRRSAGTTRHDQRNLNNPSFASGHTDLTNLLSASSIVTSQDQQHDDQQLHHRQYVLQQQYLQERFRQQQTLQEQLALQPGLAEQQQQQPSGDQQQHGISVDELYSRYQEKPVAQPVRFIEYGDGHVFYYMDDGDDELHAHSGGGAEQEARGNEAQGHGHADEASE